MKTSQWDYPFCLQKEGIARAVISLQSRFGKRPTNDSHHSGGHICGLVGPIVAADLLLSYWPRINGALWCLYLPLIFMLIKWCLVLQFISFKHPITGCCLGLLYGLWRGSHALERLIPLCLLHRCCSPLTAERQQNLGQIHKY